jgi:hypothetical protein
MFVSIVICGGNGREEYGSIALAVAIYNDEKVLVKQTRVRPNGFIGHVQRIELWLFVAAVLGIIIFGIRILKGSRL